MIVENPFFRRINMRRISRLGFILILGLALLAFSSASIHAGMFSWSGTPILNPEVDSNFFPEGDAHFVITDNMLTLTLRYTGANLQITGNNQVMTGLIWDIGDDFSGSLNPQTAMIAGGSSLIGAHAPDFVGVTDLSGAWAFKDNIEVTAIDLGSYGVGAVGDIFFGTEDSFGRWDLFDPDNRIGSAPNGINFGLVPVMSGDPPVLFELDSLRPNQSSNPDGFKNQGPVVQNTMIFTWLIEGDTLTQDQIENVRPLFGSEGVPIAEPTTMLLLGTGLVCLAGFGRKRFHRK
jgi:hypothetical protein